MLLKNLKVTPIVLEAYIDLLQKNNYGDVDSKGGNFLFGHCPVCNRKESMTASDNTIQAERLRSFFENLVKEFC